MAMKIDLKHAIKPGGAAVVSVVAINMATQFINDKYDSDMANKGRVGMSAGLVLLALMKIKDPATRNALLAIGIVSGIPALLRVLKQDQYAKYVTLQGDSAPALPPGKIAMSPEEIEAAVNAYLPAAMRTAEVSGYDDQPMFLPAPPEMHGEEIIPDEMHGMDEMNGDVWNDTLFGDDDPFSHTM